MPEMIITVTMAETTPIMTAVVVASVLLAAKNTTDTPNNSGPVHRGHLEPHGVRNNVCTDEGPWTAVRWIKFVSRGS